MSTQQKSTNRTIVTIGGMTCAGCASTIKEALESKEGVMVATVDLENGTASLSYDPESVSTDDFKLTVEEAGYDFINIR